MWIPIVFGSQDKHNSNKRLILITECKGLLKKGIKRPKFDIYVICIISIWLCDMNITLLLINVSFCRMSLHYEIEFHASFVLCLSLCSCDLKYCTTK